MMDYKSTNAFPATAAVLMKSASTFDASQGSVRGLDFESDKKDYVPSLDDLLASMRTTGFQATNIGLACDEINRMLAWEQDDAAAKKLSEDGVASVVKERCTIFLSFTSNMISSGLKSRFANEYLMLITIVSKVCASQ